MDAYKLSVIPFSMGGSFLKVSPRHRHPHRVRIGTVRKSAVTQKDMPFWAHDFYDIVLLRDGQEVPYAASAQPWRLDLEADGGRATVAFQDADTLLFEAEGVDLRLVSCGAYGWTYRPRPDTLQMFNYWARCVHTLRWPAGAELAAEESLTADGTKGLWNDKALTLTLSGPGPIRCALRSTRVEPQWTEPLPDMGDVLAERRAEYEAWQALRPAAPERYAEAAEEAWHLLWHCRVPAEGLFTRPAILMSKNWMNQVWAWDNCFSALAVARADPALAWGQILLLLDHQAPNGMCPDHVNDDECRFGYVKPPIQGWTVMKLVQMLGADVCRPFIAEAYEPIGRLTEWWYAYRDRDGDGMCQYLHGNDSGWDNATVFDQGQPTEGADLAAHLVLQTEGLALMADLLDRRDEAKRWRERSRRQLRNLLEQGVRDGRFISPLDGQSDAEHTSCLLNRVPTVLGRRLPPAILEAMVEDLSPGGPFLTDHGLATESPQSPKYTPDGYWRGPIWAPSTYLIFDGLADAGRIDLARTIAERFCDMCAANPGMYENYDALTGKGLCCPGYSWTGAVFLLLAEWLGYQER